MADPTPAPKIVLLGAPRQPLRDAYHALVRLPWPVALGTIAAGFLAMNLVFAFLYFEAGGVDHAETFFDDFAFSVQTSGTIGYGAMTPHSTLANALVTAESVTSLILTALATGLVFSKFSRSTGRLRFTTRPVIVPFDGVPTLMIRFGNERSNRIVEAQIRVAFSRTEITKEGERFYRMYDLPLVRDRALSLTRSWTVMHPLTDWSPLYQQTPATLAASDAEIYVSVMGTDDTTMSTVHAAKTYDHTEIAWGHRFADILRDGPDGEFIVDLGKFDELEPGQPTPEFPYP